MLDLTRSQNQQPASTVRPVDRKTYVDGNAGDKNIMNASWVNPCADFKTDCMVLGKNYEPVLQKSVGADGVLMKLSPRA